MIEFKWKKTKEIKTQNDDGTNIKYKYYFTEPGDLGDKELVLTSEGRLSEIGQESTIKVELEKKQTIVS